MAEVAASANSTGEKKRFATVDEEQFKQLLYEKDAKNTRRATESAVRTFKSYLKEKKMNESFENFTNSDLDGILSKFYAEVRTENGELYKKSSLISIRHGLNRHLSNVVSGKDLIHGGDFTESKKAFAAAVKELKREGKGGVTHYPPIELTDLQKLYEYFDTDNNIKLLEKVFVDVMLYFGRRGRENMHDLKRSDFAATSDSNGQIYVYMTCDELTKNHQEDENTADGRMYSRDDELCPVRSFNKYMKHIRGNKCNRFFQKPSIKPTSLKWYDSAPLGHNTIGNLMSVISQNAGLSVRYTNHSLRATAVHVLDNVGNFASRHIMTVTGHKSEASLKTYTGHTGEGIKKRMSDTISSTLRTSTCTSAKQVCVREESSAAFELQPLSNSQFNDLVQDVGNDNFDDFLAGMDLSDFTNEKENVTVDRTHDGTANLMAAKQPQMPVPIFRNCSNITINYNFK